jgi:hypothetical protein
MREGMVIIIMGVVFLLLAAGVFVLELASPFVGGYSSGATETLLVLGGAFGIVLIGLGMIHDRSGGRR